LAEGLRPDPLGELPRPAIWSKELRPIGRGKGGGKGQGRGREGRREGKGGRKVYCEVLKGEYLENRALYTQSYYRPVKLL